MSQPNIVVEFEDRYGEKRLIHKTRRGLALKRRDSTVPLALSKLIGPLIGERVRAARQKKGWSLSKLCSRAGIVSATPKSRMYEIEKSTRSDGVRFGTLYAIALALEIPIGDLLPSTEEVSKLSGVEVVSLGEQLSLTGGQR